MVIAQSSAYGGMEGIGVRTMSGRSRRLLMRRRARADELLAFHDVGRADATGEGEVTGRTALKPESERVTIGLRPTGRLIMKIPDDEAARQDSLTHAVAEAIEAATGHMGRQRRAAGVGDSLSPSAVTPAARAMDTVIGEHPVADDRRPPRQTAPAPRRAPDGTSRVDTPSGGSRLGSMAAA